MLIKPLHESTTRTSTKTSLIHTYYIHVKRFQNLTNIRSTKVEWMLDKLVERNVQTASTSSNIFENKRNDVWMLNKTLDQVKFDSTSFQHRLRFQQCWTPLFKHPRHLVQQSIERVLNQIANRLKPLNGPLSDPFNRLYSRY